MLIPSALIVYGVLLVLGGWIGYQKAGSQKSLVSGLISGLVMLVAFGLSLWQLPVGRGVGLVTALLLTGVFVGRWRATGKWMPAGLMVALSVAMAAILGLSLVGGQS